MITNVIKRYFYKLGGKDTTRDKQEYTKMRERKKEETYLQQ